MAILRYRQNKLCQNAIICRQHINDQTHLKNTSTILGNKYDANIIFASYYNLQTVKMVRRVNGRLSEK
jgi:hypothetical protein